MVERERSFISRSRRNPLPTPRSSAARLCVAVAWGALLPALAWPPAAFAGALWYNEPGPRAIAMGTAFAVAGDDLSTIFYNPAALMNTPETRIDVAASGLLSVDSFHRESETLGPFEEVENEGGAMVIPHLIGGTDFGSESLVLALGAYAPFGPARDYPADGPQRYAIVESGSTAIYYSIGLGTRILDNLKLGFTANLVQLNFEQKLMFTLDPTGLERPQLDGSFYVEADDMAWSYQLGAIYDVSPSLSVGVAYHAPVEFQIKGTAKGRLPILGWPGQDNIKVDLEFARMARAGVAYRTDRLTTELDLVWSQWSVVQELVVDFEHEYLSVFPAGDIHQERLYEDTWSPRFGISYQLYPGKLSTRLGLWYEQGAVPDETASLGSSDSDKFGISPALEFSLFAERATVTMSYMYLKFEDRHITNSILEAINPLGGNPSIIGNGELKTTAHAV
ncbi:MAG: outer membrane protein transport protein, partial [Candidatus Schekmanbacteria bacterium]|nr:outer membrane protein transport protein [Candidatus Schekmanbacteria bacterium]